MARGRGQRAQAEGPRLRGTARRLDGRCDRDDPPVRARPARPAAARQLRERLARLVPRWRELGAAVSAALRAGRNAVRPPEPSGRELVARLPRAALCRVRAVLVHAALRVPRVAAREAFLDAHLFAPLRLVVVVLRHQQAARRAHSARAPCARARHAGRVELLDCQPV